MKIILGRIYYLRDGKERSLLVEASSTAGLLNKIEAFEIDTGAKVHHIQGVEADVTRQGRIEGSGGNADLLDLDDGGGQNGPGAL